MVGYELYVIDLLFVFMSPAKTRFQIMKKFFHAKLADFDSLGVRGDLDVAPKQSHITLKRTHTQLIIDHILKGIP
jgi:hypothetical protein